MELTFSSFLNNIKNSWKENIKYIFNLENIKNMFLLAFQAMKVEKRYLFFIARIGLLFIVISDLLRWMNNESYISVLNIGLLNGFGFIVFLLSIINTIVALRPSLEKKDIKYFTKYFLRVLILSIISVLILMINKLLPIRVILPYTLTSACLITICIFYILFILDSRGKIQDYFLSFFRSILMIIYNFPIILIFKLIIYLLIESNGLLYKFGFSIYRDILIYLLAYYVMAFFISMVVNFYKMRIHEQYSLYYSEPK